MRTFLVGRNGCEVNDDPILMTENRNKIMSDDPLVVFIVRRSDKGVNEGTIIYS